MPLPFGPLMVAGATAAIAYMFQETAAKNARLRQRASAAQENRYQLRESELKRAQEIFNESSEALCELHAQLELYFPSVMSTREQDQEKRRRLYADLESAYRKWKGKQPRILGMVRACFGKAIVQRLEEISKTLNGLFHECLYVKSLDGLESPEQRVSEEIQAASTRIQELVDTMLAQIQNQYVGGLRRGAKK